MEQEGAKKERNAPTLPKQYLDGRLGASQRWQIHNQNPPVHKESVKFGQFLTKMSPSDLDPLFAHNTGEFQEPPTKRSLRCFQLSSLSFDLTLQCVSVDDRIVTIEGHS